MRLINQSKVWNVLGIFLLSILVSFNAYAQPANDNFCDAIGITVNALDTPGDCTASFPYDNTAGTTEAGETAAGCFGETGGGTIESTVWFSFVGPASGFTTLTTDFAGSGNLDTQFAVFEYTGPACPAVDFTALTEIACDEDGGVAVDYNSTLTQIATTAGTTYYVMVDGWSDGTAPSVGTFCLDITEVTAPPPPDPPDPLCGTDTETLLYDQLAGSDNPDNGGAADIVPAQEFTDFGASANAADNFTVPAGGWDIGAVSVDGTYYGTNPGCAMSWNVTIYNDAAGLPGTVACGYTVATSNTLDSPNLTFPSLCSLPAGDYWFSVEPVMPFGTCSQWGWYTSGPGDGVAPVWQDTGDLFGLGFTTWTDAVVGGLSDGNTDMAFALYECPPPTTCSITPVEGAVICDDNGTLSDPSDDTYTIEVTVNGVNPSGSNTFNDDQGNTGQAYGTTITYGPLAVGASLTISYNDVDNGFCAGSITVTAGTGCSNCSTSSGSTVTTPLCSGDPFDVTIGGCTVPGTQNGFLLMYDTDPTNAPPTQAELYDDVTGAVDLPDIFWGGESSECDNVGFTGLAGFTNVTCAVISVDLYLMPADLVNLLINGTCPVEGPLTMEIYPSYQVVESGAGTCGPVATLEVTDDSDPANPLQVVCATFGDPLAQCTADLAYDFTMDIGASPCPPATIMGSVLCNCASCSISPDPAANIICDDNGTPSDPSDDTFTFDITVNGSNPDAAASNTFNDDQGNAGLAYGSVVTYGPFPISGGAVTVNYTDADDPTCIASMMGAPPATCSPCATSSGSTITTPVCANATFDVTINGCTTTADQDGYLLMYDFDPTTPETSAEIYDDLTGVVDDPDLAYFGETSDCTSAGFTGLAGFANTTCGVESYAVYIVPFNSAGYIISTCPPEGPIQIDVYPNLAVNTTTDNSASCGDVTFELVNADDATVVCATNTQTCAVDGTAVSYDFANDGFTDPAGCSTLVSAASTCAGCVIPVYCDDPCFVEYNPNPNPGDQPDPNACITPLDCTSGTSSMMTCDDGDPCTENDMMSVLDCDNTVVCVPCMGTPVASCTNAPTMMACDDGDPCTENDMEGIDSCDGATVCVPCAGTPVVVCTLPPVMQACDDGDACTENDMEGVDPCDGTICTPCAGTAVAACTTAPMMQACDDGDPCTENDMEGIDACDGVTVCVPCAGTAVAACTNAPTMMACDDGDPCTENDMEGIDSCDGVTVCVPCAGTAVAACSLPPVMQGCDDGDPTTTGEMEGIDPCDGSVCVPCGGGTVTTMVQISIDDPCDCANPLNYSLADGTYLVQDVITITISNPAQPGDVWSLLSNAGIAIYDGSGNVMTTGTMTDNGDGTYDFAIWYPGDGSTYGPLTFTQTSTTGAVLPDQMISGTTGCNCCQAPSSGAFDCN